MLAVPIRIWREDIVTPDIADYWFQNARFKSIAISIMIIKPVFYGNLISFYDEFFIHWNYSKYIYKIVKI